MGNITTATTSTNTFINDTCTVSSSPITSNTCTISVSPTTQTNDIYTSKSFYNYLEKNYIVKVEPVNEYQTKWSRNEKGNKAMFKDIKEIVPEKVYEFTFQDGTKIKTILDKEDIFNLEYAFYLALSKKLYKDTLTFEGVLNKVYELRYEKKYAKEVEKGLKLFKKIQKEKAKEEEAEEIAKRQHKRYVRRKQEAKARKKKDQINLIAEAIRLSKEEG